MNQYPSTYSPITTPDKLDLKFAQHNQNLSVGAEHYDCHFHKLVTKTITKIPKIKRGYAMVSNQLRLELIEAVYTHGEQIKIAAKRLGINYSSAKAICQVYRREGRSGKKVPGRLKWEREKTVYAVESTPVIASWNNKSSEEVCRDKNNQGFQDNIAQWEASGKESLVVKDTAVGAYPETCKTDEVRRVSGIGNSGDHFRYPVFPPVQDIQVRKAQTPVFQPQPLQTEYSTVQSSLMHSFPSNTLISALIPNFPIQVLNPFNDPAVVHPIYQVLKTRTQNTHGFEDLNHMAKSQYLLSPNSINLLPQQQLRDVYVCFYPQNTNITTNHTKGAPVLLNSVYSTLAQHLNPQLITNDLAYRTPYS